MRIQDTNQIIRDTNAQRLESDRDARTGSVPEVLRSRGFLIGLGVAVAVGVGLVLTSRNRRSDFFEI